MNKAKLESDVRPLSLGGLFSFYCGPLSCRARLQAINEEMDKQLAQARQDNEKLSGMMGALGVSARPTVPQWLRRKQMERKAKLQESLISWDRGGQTLTASYDLHSLNSHFRASEKRGGHTG